MARTEIMMKKNSPEILLGCGIVGFVGTVVLACRGTLKADEVLEHHKKKIKDIKEAKEVAVSHPDEYEYDIVQYRQDISIQYLKTAGNMAKLYLPAASVGALSLTCILTSRNILNKRYLGAVAAYNGVSGAFNEYRKRVRDEYGEEMDRHFRYGTEMNTLTEVGTDENGKKIKTKVQTENINSSLVNPNDDSCRFFDNSNPNWLPNPTYNMMFLRGQQNYLNDRLHTVGHVFLNEVYEALGFHHTPQGAVLGWIDGGDDDCIDFGLYRDDDNIRRFVNGLQDSILLEFNHDGVIWDHI